MKSCLGRNMEQREGELQQWRNRGKRNKQEEKYLLILRNLVEIYHAENKPTYMCLTSKWDSIFQAGGSGKGSWDWTKPANHDFQRFWIIVPLSKTLDSKLFFRDCPLTELYSSVCGCDNILKSDVSALNNWFWSHPLSEQTDNCHALIYMCVPAYKDWLLQTHQR